jgi:hypothetical protein
VVAGRLTGLLLVLDLLLAVVEKEELESTFGVMVSFMRDKTVVLGRVAESTIRVVLDEGADLGAPAGRSGAVWYAHVVFAVDRWVISSLRCVRGRRDGGGYIRGGSYFAVACALRCRVPRLRDEVKSMVVGHSHGEVRALINIPFDAVLDGRL